MDEASMQDSIDRLTKAIEKLDTILMGNGKLGLISKVEMMWRSGVWLLMVAIGALGAFVGYNINGFVGK